MTGWLPAIGLTGPGEQILLHVSSPKTRNPRRANWMWRAESVASLRITGGLTTGASCRYIKGGIGHASPPPVSNPCAIIGFGCAPNFYSRRWIMTRKKRLSKSWLGIHRIERLWDCFRPIMVQFVDKNLDYCALNLSSRWVLGKKSMICANSRFSID